MQSLSKARPANSKLVPVHMHPPGIIFRPDLAVMSFRCSIEGTTPSQAIHLLEQGVQSSLIGLVKALHQDALVKMTNLSIEAGSEPKSKKAGKPHHAGRKIRIDGIVELPLPQLDYWPRARLIAGLLEAAESLCREAAELPIPIEARYSQPVALIRVAEQHRPALLTRWLDRARAFARAAEDESAPLRLLDGRVPGEIIQHPLSLEEVRLELSMQCRIDALPTA